MAEKKKIILRKKKQQPVVYDESLNGYGNLLPEAEIVAYTGSPAAQKLKRWLDEKRKKIANAKKKVSGLRMRMEERQQRRNDRQT